MAERKQKSKNIILKSHSEATNKKSKSKDPLIVIRDSPTTILLTVYIIFVSFAILYATANQSVSNLLFTAIVWGLVVTVIIIILVFVGFPYTLKFLESRKLSVRSQDKIITSKKSDKKNWIEHHPYWGAFVIAIIAGVIAIFVYTVIILPLITPQPNITIEFSPGTEFLNQTNSLYYKSFSIDIKNEGKAQANYLTFFVDTAQNITYAKNESTFNYGIYIRNVSINKAAYSCVAEDTNNVSLQIAISNFGPQQKCDLTVNVYLIVSGKYETIQNYTNLINYFNDNYTRMFNVTTPISDSNNCQLYFSQQPINPAIPMAVGVTSANGYVSIPIHQGFTGLAEPCLTS
jgi:hypothetical protein